MGMLRRKDTRPSDGLFLKSETRIGRVADNDIVIARPSISARHATLSWTASGWVLRDTSTYGTLVSGMLVKGAARPLRPGDELTFVEADENWVLENAAPPGLLLTPVDNPSTPAIHVDSDRGLLALPSSASPDHTLMKVHEAWFIELDSGARRKLVDGSTVTLSGTAYRVSVPSPSVQTAEPENPVAPFSLANAHLAITVLRGEDEAALTIRAAGLERSLKPSRPLYLLAYLAEQRIRAGVDDDGWLPTDLACKELGVERPFLNVDVFRVREAVKNTGLANGADVVQRQASQIRIGVPPSRCTVTRP